MALSKRRRLREPTPWSRIGRSKKTAVETSGVCELNGKRRFPTERDAVRGAAYIKARNATKSRKALATTVYRCTVRGGCGDWHLTRGGRRTPE